MNEAVSGVITLWRDGIPFWFDIYADPICSILKGKSCWSALMMLSQTICTLSSPCCRMGTPG